MESPQIISLLNPGVFVYQGKTWLLVRVAESMAQKEGFLLFPVLLALAGIWCTQLSIYTLPFRASRTRFGSLLLLAWWDAGRVVWMYWVGIVRLSEALGTSVLRRLATDAAVAEIGAGR